MRLFKGSERVFDEAALIAAREKSWSRKSRTPLKDKHRVTSTTVGPAVLMVGTFGKYEPMSISPVTAVKGLNEIIDAGGKILHVRKFNEGTDHALLVIASFGNTPDKSSRRRI